MTHPPEHELLAFADGELSTSRVHDVSGHLAECALCGTRLDEIRRSGARIPVLLSALDHRPFDVSASALIARATRPTTPRATRSITPRWHSLIAAGIALLFLGSVATAAVPASIIRQYLARLFAVPSSTEPRRGSAPVAMGAPEAVGANGVSFVPESTVDVLFRADQATGSIRVTLRDEPAVRVEHYAGSAGYALTANGIAVENTGAHASYTLMLPRSARQIIVRIGTRTVFTRSNDHIATAAAKDSSGSYLLVFSHVRKENR